MKKFSAGGFKIGIKILIIPIGWLCLASLARSEEATLAFTVPSKSVKAGENFSVWMNALNASGSEISWTFPAAIPTKIISSQGTFDGSLALSSTGTNAVVIPPGGFVRHEYVAAIPEAVSGQVILQFSGLNANPVLLDVPPPVAAAAVPDAKKRDSFFTRFVREAEPEAAGKGWEPNRFFKEQISGYQPMYFIAGSKAPSGKFQVSFAYQLLNNEGPLAEEVPELKGFHVAYTQTSLWDLKAPSAPFYDTTYRPEFFYSCENVTRADPTNWFQLDLQIGLEHQSNGKGGADSRSMNMAYFQPTFTFGRDDGLQLSFQPRAWIYLGSLSDNPDIKDYNGYVNLRTVLGWQRGLQLSALGQMGKNANRGSVQLDLTYPTMRFFGSFSLYLDVQYFNGYGESLLGYNQRTDELRVGFALFR